MPLAPGHRLGVYEITASLGAGGMGEVYRARDTALNRDVAVKILPDTFAADADRVARFKREAQVLASLNHPNIAQIYGIESNALVMELVEGDDLASIVARGPMAVAEALPVARQIADALETAHEQGIIHRDLKPANIKVRPDGTVKVLDFGLAKAIDPSVSTAVDNSPTLTAHATAMGTIIGTAAYMAPEQAKGRAVDKRADIWAFGTVLYEMLTGDRAFKGDDVSEILAAVIRDTPRFDALPATTPSAVRRLLERCLERDVKLRLRDIGEARIALGGSAVEAPAAALAPARAAGGPLRAAGAIVVLLAVAGASAWLGARRSPQAFPALAPGLIQVTSDAGVTFEPVVAPNGSLIAYASDRGGGGLDIWVQPLPTGEPVRITRDPADDSEPDFSPDGSRIVFRSERDGGGIYEVPALGGTARLVAAKGRAPKYSPDGTHIAYLVGGRGVATRLWVTDTAGGTPRPLTSDTQSVGPALWCLDGQSLLAWLTTPRPGNRQADRAADVENAKLDWATVDLTTGATQVLGAASVLDASGIAVHSPLAWLGDAVVIAQDGLWAVPMDGCRGVRGPPHRLTTGEDVSASVVRTADGLRLFSASVDHRSNLFRLPVPPTDPDAPVVTPLTDTAATDLWPSVSSDGKILLFTSRHDGRPLGRARDLATGTDTVLPNVEQTPVISPDGRSFVDRRGQSLVIQPIAGGDVRTIDLKRKLWLAWDWPRPSLVVASLSLTEPVVVNLDTGRLVPILASEMTSGLARLSPDGRWVSLMQWTAADRSRIIVLPFNGSTPATPEQVIPITDDAAVAEESVWSADGNTLYFVSDQDGYRCLWSRRLDPTTRQPIGPITAVAHFHRARRQMIGSIMSPQRLDRLGSSLIFSVTDTRSNVWTGSVRNQP